ncbi:MAG: two-component regulator propeller domain-containing protein [Niabella sp.]
MIELEKTLLIHKCILSLLFLGLPGWLCYIHATPPSLIYKQITNEEGLSNSSINCIYQDSSGLMWFGTWDGLNVYNGSGFRVYKPESKNAKSISNNIIRSIIEERKNILWIATDDGVNRFDAVSREFQRYYFHGNEPNTHREKPYLLAKNRKNLIFCAVYELGLSYYNQQKNEFVPFQIPGVNTFRVKSFFFDSSDYMWLLLESGELFQIEVIVDKQGKISSVDAQKISTDKASYFFPDETRSNIWLLTLGNSVRLLNCKTKETTGYLLPDGLSNGRITAITSYAGQLVISQATKGLFFCRTEDDKLVVDRTLFSSQGIFSVYTGTQSILWVGSDGQGIYKVYPNQKQFYNFPANSITGITSNPIRCFAETSPGALYIGTKGSGMYRVEINGTGDNKLVQRFNISTGLKNDAVYALYPKKEFLWIGTDARGIQVLHTPTGRLQSFFDESNLPSDIQFGSVYAICETSDSTLWLGTSGYGLIQLKVKYGQEGVSILGYRQFSFDRNKEKWLSSNIIYALYPDTKLNTLWIGTRGGGLNRFDISKDSFDVFKVSKNDNSISSNDVLCIIADKRGALWVGTSYGINYFQYYSSLRQPKVTSYFDTHGLPNNTIHGIVTDAQDNLWISTNKGISKYILTENRFINYASGEGLQSNEFSDGAYYRSQYDGYIYFGGIAGMNRFRSSEIVTSNFEPRIFLNALKLYNQREIPVGSSIQLRYNENFFSVDFSASEYINSEKCEYAYMLENFNDDWVYIGTTHSADFTNVPPGKYLLRIKATNSDRLWSSFEYSLPIQVGLPWWRTGIAYMLYTIAGIALLYLVYRIIKLRIKDHTSLWEERLNRKKEYEIHEAKLRFFTNIAHEFFTPLTLIYGPCEKISEYRFSDAYVRRNTHIIKSNAERMLSLIQQLMEFRRTESELPPLYLEDVDIPEMLSFISHSFSETIDSRHIKYTVKRDEDALYWRTDRSSLEKIVYNLLSNAFKYTSDKGEVSIEVKRDEAMLMISVTNSGKGISKDDIEHLFNRFKILGDSEKKTNGAIHTRTGLGLWLTKNLVEQLGGAIEVSSEQGSYTAFTVSIPMGSRSSVQEVKELAADNDWRPGKEPGITSFEDKNADILDESPSVKTNRILVVEDDDDIRNFLSSVLKEEYTITAAVSATDALETMKHQLPHLIISDVLMDGMNGFELTREIRANPITRHIPVVLLTGKRTIDDQMRGLSEGADVYLGKPFYPSYLKVIVQRLLSTRRELKEYYSSVSANTEMYNGTALIREDYEFLLSVTRLVESHIDKEELNPAFLASKMTMSKTQFYRRLKDITGQTSSEFIRGVRLKFAAKQIQLTKKTIQEIMFESGFNNKAYFFREFHKMFGLSPREYRNESKE